MVAIIRTNDKNLFESLLSFLKSLHITIETKEEIKSIPITKSKKDFNEAVKFWKSLKVDMSNFRFSREDAYER